MVNPKLLTLALASTLLAGCPTSDEPSATSATDAGSSSSSSSSTSGPVPDTADDDPDTTTTSGTSEPSSSTTTMVGGGFCGDGSIDVDEECDDGQQNDDDGLCSTLCVLNCGDGVLQESEECDQGPDNSNTGMCTKICEQARCGDEFVQPGETCDDGDAQNSVEPGGCHPETCTLVLSSCGNGVLDAGEVCDPSAPGMDTVSCTKSCSLASRTIFASSETFPPHFGSLDKADLACTKLAAEAGLEQPESFIAFLSTPQETASSRVGHFIGEYKDTSGKLLATGNLEFFSGTLKAPIGRDEYGLDATQNSTFAWTGSTHAGDSSEPSCKSWTSIELKVFGVVGSLMATNSEWANTKTSTCKDKAHLYCVEVNG